MVAAGKATPNRYERIKEIIMSTTNTMNVSRQRAPLQAQLTALLTGIKKDLAGVDPIDLDGVTTKQSELVARTQALLDAIAAVKAQRTLLLTAVAKQKDLLTQYRGVRVAMKRFLQTKFGPQSPKLQDFGFTQTHQGKATVEAKAAARAQAKATRALRHTAGKKQKQAIKALPSATAATPIAATPQGPKPGTTPIS
jgi:hypothetical protein